MKAIALFILILSLSLLSGCSDDPTKPAEHKTEGTTQEISVSGGTISLGDVTVEIPPSAISSKATFTLNRLGYDLADSLDVEAEMMSQPVSMTIGTAEIADTIYVLLPAFDSSDKWNVVGFKVGGVWYPLSVVEQDATHTRVAIPPELFGSGKSGKATAKGIETIPGYIIAGMNLLIPNPSNVSLRPPGSRLNTPAIVLIHGILSDSNRWESVFIDSLNSLGAEVYYLEYPWKDHFMDVAPEVIGTLKQQLGNRDIYFACHSKGGLLARAVIRLNETDNSGLSIKRVLFFDTPHYGVSYLTAIELLLKGMYAKENGLIMPGAMLCEGISELNSGSSELAAIAQSLSFLDRPLYKCIIADDGVLGVVSASSADLAREEHNSERENAVYCSTDSMACEHWTITNYNKDAWPVIEEFLYVQDDLIAYYPFNGNADDESGNGNNGIVHGATPTEDRFGNPNRAYLFDGDNDWLFIADSPDFHFADKFTISFWVMLETEAPYFYPYKIIEKNRCLNVMQRGWNMIMGFTDQSGADIDVPWDTPGISNLSPGIWYHFIMTFDGTIQDNNLKAFKNGDLIYAADCPGKTVFQSNSNVVLSYYEPSPDKDGIGYYFDGAIDDIRFYNRALSEGEAQYIYNSR